MSDEAPFPVAYRAVADLLAGVDGVLAAYAGPATLATIGTGKLPAVRVMRTGGTDDSITDASTVAVAVFAGDADTADRLAALCQQRLLSGPFRGTSFATAHGTIDRAVTLTGPQLATAFDTAGAQCVTASYRISMRH